MHLHQMHSRAACKSNTSLSHKKLPTLFTKAPWGLLLSQISGHSGCNFFASAKSWFQFVAMNSCFLTCMPKCCWLCLLLDVLSSFYAMCGCSMLHALLQIPQSTLIIVDLHSSSSFYKLFPFQWSPAFVSVFVRLGTLSAVGRTVLRKNSGSEQSNGKKWNKMEQVLTNNSNRS